MRDIFKIGAGVVLGQAIWGCLPFLLLLGVAGLFIVVAIGIQYWWLILIGVAVAVLLNMGSNGQQLRHAAGHYATQITGYRPRAYVLPSPWSVKVIHPNGAMQRMPVSRAGCWVGRSADCQIRLSEPSVSRHHCWLGEQGGYFQVRDNSSHGTMVNGRRVGQAYLQPGDEVQVGRTRLQVRR